MPDGGSDAAACFRCGEHPARYCVECVDQLAPVDAGQETYSAVDQIVAALIEAGHCTPSAELAICVLNALAPEEETANA